MERVRLVDWLKSERDQHVGGGLYYNSQILFAYNSNHMEGSTLSPEQTAQLFNTGALLPDNINDEIRADDVAETTNHFNAFNWVLDHVDDPVNKSLVCSLHGILKRGTSQEFDANRNVGGYKIVPNVISQLEGIHTVLPADVPLAMKQVFSLYSQLEDDPFTIAKAHWMFESTHPFSDGNGRIGRLVMFKELLRLDSVPALVLDEHHNLYTRALKNFPSEPGYLVDLLLNERDYYQRMIETYAPNRIRYSYVDQWNQAGILRHLNHHPTSHARNRQDQPQYAERYQWAKHATFCP